MRPMKFVGMNTVLSPPKTWDSEVNGVCAPLPVQLEGGYSISAWKPSREEFEKLIDGGWIYACVAVGESGTQPPIAVAVKEAMPAQ